MTRTVLAFRLPTKCCGNPRVETSISPFTDFVLGKPLLRGGRKVDVLCGDWLGGACAASVIAVHVGLFVRDFS